MSNNQQAFLALVRAGLWEKEVQLAPLGVIDWNEIYRLSVAQSVTGLALAGLENSDIKPPQELVLQWIGEVQLIEQRNKAMNAYIAELIEKLRKEDIYALLVKGQGVAQCYERPLWRACGDVDLLLSDSNYERAKEFLIPLSSSVEAEGVRSKHLGMTIQTWVIELHGTLQSCCLKQMDRVIDDVQRDVFYGGNVRSWQNGLTQVFLPSFNNDVFLVFTHIIKHFFREGVGLRQVCDWCRMLWMCKESLDYNLLQRRLCKAGIMTEWMAFASFAVEYLGMPIGVMPFYSDSPNWSKKAERIYEYILRVGNFGHNREKISRKDKYVVRKTKAFNRRISDAMNHLMIFPLDSIRVLFRTMLYGIIGFAKGE